MERIPVDSSQIAEIGYDREKSVLEIQFKRGLTVYHYADVPPEVYYDLMHSESIGRYFNAQVKEHYAYHKLTPEEANASSQAQADATKTNDGPSTS